MWQSACWREASSKQQLGQGTGYCSVADFLFLWCVQEAGGGDAGHLGAPSAAAAFPAAPSDDFYVQRLQREGSGNSPVVSERINTSR